MPVSVEARAVVSNVNSVRARVAAVTPVEPVISDQDDVVFDVRRGRLMIRRTGGSAELIFYVKPEIPEPRFSTYFRRALLDPESVETELTQRFGVRSRVKKRRWTFGVDDFRINLDLVESLGAFVEVAVPVSSLAERPRALARMRRLLDALNITADDLVGDEYETLLARPSAASAEGGNG